MTRDRRMTMAEAAATVPDGAKIGFGGSIGLYRRPMSFARELVRQRRRDLNVYGVINGLEADLLVGAGCVAATHSSYIGLDELGQAPNFQEQVGDGRVTAHEYGEWLITGAYRATNMGLPFLPWRSGRHTDVARELGLVDITCPYTGVELLAVRAIELDIAVIQVQRCDAAGNAELPTPKEHMYDVDALLAHAAKRIIVCAEEVAEVDPDRVQLISREVEAVVHAPRGAWPCGLHPVYGIDRRHITDEYLAAVQDGDFDGYLKRFVLDEAVSA